MLPDDYGFSRMMRQWETEEERRAQLPDAEDMEEDDDENHD